MRDYDVAAVGLDSPPAEAFKTTYRPAISVENLGVHSVLVTGYIAILNRDTGLQVFASPITLATLSPGTTKPAPATSPWTADTEGNYLAYGYATCEHDSYSPNNNLAPVEFHVGPGTPPVPVVVPAHAPQHEAGASDELIVDGLVGVLADPQEPEEHAADHQVGGKDQLSIGGLSGKAAEAQTPVTHSNSYHNPTLATSQELTAHQGATAVHSAALNLANRETTGPETGMVKLAQICGRSVIFPTGDRYLRSDQYWHTPVPDYIIVLWDGTNPIPAGWLAIVITPTPTPPYIWITRLPTP